MYQMTKASRRLLLTLLAAAAAALMTGCAGTPQPAHQEPEEGFEYRAPATPFPVSAPGAEVVEFFWFGCPHCNALEPLLKAWQKTLPADVVLRKVHVGLAPRWVPHQQLYYALTALGKAEDLNDRVFRALHVDGIRLDDREAMADFVARNGVDRAQFMQAFDSKAVKDAMARADEHARVLEVKGVPTLAVNGRWITSPTMAGGNAPALKVVDFLLQQDRAARGEVTPR